MTDHEGKHRLKGPGLDPTVGAGGVSHMGGKWPSRLAEICLEITGEFEDQEMEIYRTWKTEENNLLGDFLCRNSNRLATASLEYSIFCSSGLDWTGA